MNQAASTYRRFRADIERKHEDGEITLDEFERHIDALDCELEDHHDRKREDARDPYR